MARRRHSPDQILSKLRDADVMLADGVPLAGVAKRLEISEQTYHRWRRAYGSSSTDQVRRLKVLERENGELKKLLADQLLENKILKDVAEGNF